MMRAFPLLLLAGFAAEIASIIWVGSRLGVAAALLLLFGGGLLGISLIRSAGTTAMAALRAPMNSAAGFRDFSETALSRVLAGLLFLIPGFFSDVAGLLLLLPPVRRWLGARFRVERFAPRPSPARGYGEIIDVEAVEITAEVEPPRPPREDR